MGAELPWFPLYAGDWLGGEGPSMMLPEQEGAFIRLLAIAWGDGSRDPSLPDDDRALAQMSRLGPRWKRLGALVREQFEARDGRLYNARLSAIWHEQQAKHDRRVRAGSEGGKARASRRQSSSIATSIATPTLQQSPTNGVANGNQPESESERETELTSSSGELAAMLPSDNDRAALRLLLATVPMPEAWLAEMRASLDGMSGHVALTPPQLAQALRDYVANGASRDPSLKHFRAYLRRSTAPEADGPPSRRRAARTSAPAATATSSGGKLKSM